MRMYVCVAIVNNANHAHKPDCISNYLINEQLSHLTQSRDRHLLKRYLAPPPPNKEPPGMLPAVGSMLAMPLQTPIPSSASAALLSKMNCEHNTAKSNSMHRK
jgi:hypothetical protein